MCETLPFNVNHYVRVKLNDRGRHILSDEHYHYWGGAKPYKPREEDSEGYSRWQMWSLMQTFGKHIHLGCQMPFDCVILVETKQ